MERGHGSFLSGAGTEDEAVTEYSGREDINTYITCWKISLLGDQTEDIIKDEGQSRRCGCKIVGGKADL